MNSIISGIDIESLIPRRQGSVEEGSNSERSWQDEMEDNVCSALPSLTVKERIAGCLACVTVGYILSFGSWMRFSSLLHGNPFPFVFTSTIGNIVSLSGACFLSGPRSQANKMFHPSRRIASILYLSSMAITFLIAFTCSGFSWQAPLMVILVFTQYICIAWYCMSYIPFARQWVKRHCTRWFNEMLEE
jgi:hypothetical protein